MSVFNVNKFPPVVTLEQAGNRVALFFLIIKHYIWDLIILNFVFILFSIPIITIIPAWSAMVYAFNNLINGDNDTVTNYLLSFKRFIIEKWKIWLTQILIMITLAYSLLFYYNAGFIKDVGAFKLPTYLSGFGLLIWLITNIYLYPLALDFNYKSLKNLYKTSFLFIGVNFLPSFLCKVLFVGCVILLFKFPVLLIFFSTIFFSLAALINALIYDYVKNIK